MGVLCLGMAVTQKELPEKRYTIDEESPDVDELNGVVDEFLSDLVGAATDEEKREVMEFYFEQVSKLGLFKYSFRNQMSLISQIQHREDFDGSCNFFFHGYNTWQDEFNRQVKGGETGFKVLAPGDIDYLCPECGCTPDYHKNHTWMNCQYAGSSPSSWSVNPEEEWEKGVVFWKTVTTFEYSQTKPIDDDAWEPVDMSVKGDGGEQLYENLKRIASEKGISVEEKTHVGTVKGSSSGENNVTIEKNESTETKAAILIHEIAHEVLHSIEKRGEMDTPVKEFEAEAVAYIVGRYHGLEMDKSELYVSGWIDDDKNIVEARFKEINKLSQKLIEKTTSPVLSND